MFTFESARSYSTRHAANDDGSHMSTTQASTAFLQLVQELMDKNPGMDSATAFRHIQGTAEGQALMNTYNGNEQCKVFANRSASEGYRAPSAGPCDEDSSASETLDYLARELMKRDKELSYVQAVEQVLSEDHALRVAYGKQG